jgi:hypothetical protein
MAPVMITIPALTRAEQPLMRAKVAVDIQISQNKKTF